MTRRTNRSAKPIKPLEAVQTSAPEQVVEAIPEEVSKPLFETMPFIIRINNEPLFDEISSKRYQAGTLRDDVLKTDNVMLWLSSGKMTRL